MNIKELKDFFSVSDYSSETKSVISGILDNETGVTPSLISKIKNILQKELDSDFNELAQEVKDDPEFKEIEKEYVDALGAIEKDLNDDMSFVEKELKELDEVRKKVAEVSDKMEADKIKADMQK